jgi:hypothetical protein
MVLFWSHFMTHFLQTGLIFNIETSKSFNGLARFGLGGLLGSLFGLTSRSLWVSLWSSKRSYLVSFRSLLGLAQGETKQDQERPKQDRRDRNKTKRRLI